MGRWTWIMRTRFQLLQRKSSRTRSFCLDEFEVTDVADAFIIARLFNALFVVEGVILVTTSNRAPSVLYQDGLNRHVFLPTINAINNSCDVISLEDSLTDYRGQKIRSNVSSRFMFDSEPLTALWEERIREEGGPISQSLETALDSNGNLTMATRSAHIPLVSPHSTICSFTFTELCESNPGGNVPFGAAEFSMLASHFSVIFVSDIPNFNNDGITIDGLRRFVLFIDSCYDHKCELYLSTSHGDIGQLWDATQEIVDPRSMNEHGDLLGTSSVVAVDTHTKFSLDRTISRLYEMSSDEYIKSSRERSDNR